MPQHAPLQGKTLFSSAQKLLLLIVKSFAIAFSEPASETEDAQRVADRSEAIMVHVAPDFVLTARCQIKLSLQAMVVLRHGNC